MSLGSGGVWGWCGGAAATAEPAAIPGARRVPKLCSPAVTSAAFPRARGRTITSAVTRRPGSDGRQNLAAPGEPEHGAGNAPPLEMMAEFPQNEAPEYITVILVSISRALKRSPQRWSYKPCNGTNCPALILLLSQKSVTQLVKSKCHSKELM